MELKRYAALEEIVKLIQIYSEKHGLSWEDGFKKACKVLEQEIEKGMLLANQSNKNIPKNTRYSISNIKYLGNSEVDNKRRM